MIKNIFSKIEQSIDKYNKHHSPESTAKFVERGKSFTKIEFSGSFCANSCNISDWFDDFKIELEKKGLKVNISDIKENDDCYLVKFNLKE
jgi:inhibitor of KinA sporulation pathway (predicted exonuclease)